MSNVHDNEILSYEINLKQNKIVIHTEYIIPNKTENTTIFFYDVLAHFFDTQLPGSIILDIDTYDIHHFITDNKELLEKHKNYSWPMDYTTIDELEGKLIQEQYKYFIISSSYGLSGWVLAKKYEINVIEM
ncbi:hypothetical protein [Paenibacillus sp. UMB4589-SE434]|uniref:hypothetical protein n=1 Tax=Paenibacillus sp. UMB4589-SE434 TaxID=3046314 RepID=UPI0025514263|nr:hypothetical protein [Paenibacillus sp. UMB4589-SE434]MDK8179599.1 hypothetical protein [Paenibacillus sp. UMB4589-SE434]